MRATGRIPAALRVKAFLGSYPLRLLLKDGNQVLLGRGSTSLIACITFISGRKYSSPVVEAGNFCESADCRLLIGGDHENSKIYNGTFASFPVIRAALKAEGSENWKGDAQSPTYVGHGVVLSSGCTILQGATIGPGTVVGASSVVTGTPIPRNVIAAGNPARVIRSRLDAASLHMAEQLEWWNWDITTLLQHARFLLDTEKHFSDLMRVKKLADDRFRLMIDISDKNDSNTHYNVKVVGYEDHDLFIALQDAPTRIANYFRQMHLPEEQCLTWVPDIFNESLN